MAAKRRKRRIRIRVLSFLDVFSGIGVGQSLCSKDEQTAQPRSGVKSIAHGASRGLAVKSAVSVTHGWRRGLCSVVPIPNRDYSFGHSTENVEEPVLSVLCLFVAHDSVFYLAG